VRRLESNKDTLETFTIDGLNERRFAMSRWRVPVLYVNKRRRRNCLHTRNKEEEEEEEEPELDEP
jgi:hypothetical protein